MTEFGLCQCGCGQPAPVATRTVRSRGRIKGQPMRFIRGHNATGMDRSKPYKTVRYIEEDRGYESPCWIWQLKTHPNTGYGSFRINGRDYLAHRWYYEQAKGPIPTGLKIDHLCRVRSCVNPDHLEAVTHFVNVRRGSSTKVTREEAQLMVELSEKGYAGRRIAMLMGYSQGTVNLILKHGYDSVRIPKRSN